MRGEIVDLACCVIGCSYAAIRGVLRSPTSPCIRCISPSGMYSAPGAPRNIEYKISIGTIRAVRRIVRVCSVIAKVVCARIPLTSASGLGIVCRRISSDRIPVAVNDCYGSVPPIKDKAAQSKWVPEVYRIVVYIAVEIRTAACKPNWVFGDEPANGWIVVSGAIVDRANSGSPARLVIGMGSI
jgi:hypothetical protein